MDFVIHRINKINDLKRIPKKYGCEIDIRTNGSNLILHHEPFQNGDLFIDYLDSYDNNLLVLNIKEAGIEKYVIAELKKRNINNYFLLDLEFPYIYNATRQGIREIAIRFSEDEPIELLENYIKNVNWVWIDTNTILPINKLNLKIINKVKSCLVSPERWGRPYDIITYKKKFKKLNFTPSAIMTDLVNIKIWENEIN